MLSMQQTTVVSYTPLLVWNEQRRGDKMERKRVEAKLPVYVNTLKTVKNPSINHKFHTGDAKRSHT